MLDENTYIVTGYSVAVKTRVKRCAPVSTDFMKYSIISFKYLAYWKNDMKIVYFNELYIPIHVLFCIMCRFVENKVSFQHKIFDSQI